MAVQYRELRLTKSQRKKLEDLAWAQRTNMAAIASQIVAGYAGGRPRPQDPSEPVTESIKVSVSDETWEHARARAAVEQRGISEVVRAAIDDLAAP